ncbi:MAG: HD domain-containing protein [Patescibacteria group bacterium]
MQTLYALSLLQAKLEADLNKVQRWSQFQASSNSRPQTTLDHTATVQLVATLVVQAERRHNPEPFDAAYVHQMCAVHDLGEVVYSNVGCDVVLTNKTEQTDVNEVSAVRKLLHSLTDTHQEELLERFMGQFALRKNSLSSEEKAALEKLADEKRLECMLFEAIEHLDYLLYAYREYLTRGNLRIVVKVLRDSHPWLKELAEQLPGFGREIYTPALIAWADDLCEQTKGLELEDIPDRGPKPE